MSGSGAVFGIGGKGSAGSSDKVEFNQGVDIVARILSALGSSRCTLILGDECFRRAFGTSGAVFERCAAGLRMS